MALEDALAAIDEAAAGVAAARVAVAAALEQAAAASEDAKQPEQPEPPRLELAPIENTTSTTGGGANLEQHGGAGDTTGVITAPTADEAAATADAAAEAAPGVNPSQHDGPPEIPAGAALSDSSSSSSESSPGSQGDGQSGSTTEPGTAEL